MYKQKTGSQQKNKTLTYRIKSKAHGYPCALPWPDPLRKKKPARCATSGLFLS
jgi:hypothetical protein